MYWECFEPMTAHIRIYLYVPELHALPSLDNHSWYASSSSTEKYISGTPLHNKWNVNVLSVSCILSTSPSSTTYSCPWESLHDLLKKG